MALRKSGLACVALLAAMGMGGTAAAESSVELYGLVDAWAGATKMPGDLDHTWTQGGGGMSTSYWGLKGSEDLGGGTQAIFKMEGFFRPQTGQAGRFDGDHFFARNAYVGLKNDTLGTVKLGRVTTSYFVSTILFNPFGDSYTFSPMVFHTYLGLEGQGITGDSGWDHTVMYTTPDFKGLSASVAYAFGNDPNHTGQNKWSANLLYFNGPFAATVAYQQVRFNNTPGDLGTIVPGFRDQRAVQLGVTYDLSFVKLFGQYQYIRNTIDSGDVTMNGGQLGVSIPFGGGNVLASYAYTRSTGASDVKRNTWALGYDYNLSKRTDVYVAYMSDRATDLSNGSTYGVGMRVKF
jgi:predicted porin